MDSQPGTQEIMRPGSTICRHTRSRGARTTKVFSIFMAQTRRIAANLPFDSLDDLPGIDDAALVDHHLVVEDHRAVAHRHVVVTAGRALAAALAVRPGREQEVAGEGP